MFENKDEVQITTVKTNKERGVNEMINQMKSEVIEMTKSLIVNNEVIENQRVNEMKTLQYTQLKEIKDTETKDRNELTFKGIITNKLLGLESGLLKKEFDTYDNVIEFYNTKIHSILLEDTIHIVLDSIEELEDECRTKTEILYNNFLNKVKEIALRETRNKEIEAKNDLKNELKSKVLDIAMIIIDNCYLDTTIELEELDSIIVDLPDLQYFYEEVLDRETKRVLEEELMEELVIELKYKEGYVIGYDGEKPKIILNERYYNENLEDYDDECYGSIKFINTGEIKKRENKVKTIFEDLDEELREIVESETEVKFTEIVEEIEDMHEYLSDTSNQEWLVESLLQDLIESVDFEQMFISLCDSYNGEEEGFKKVPYEVMKFYIEDKDLVEKLRKVAEDKIDFQYRAPNRY